MAAPVTSVKEYADSASIPPSYAYYNSTSDYDDDQIICDPLLSGSIPVIDFSRLTSPIPDQRSTVVRHLGAACRDWGFFMVTSDRIPLVVTYVDMELEAHNRSFIWGSTNEKKKPHLVKWEQRQMESVLLPSPNQFGLAAAEKLIDLKKKDWRAFIQGDESGEGVVNHGVPVEMMAAVMNGLERFFDLTAEEKQEFQGNHVLDPIRCGTSFNSSVDKVFFWRDFLKVLVHPSFHFPHKPPGLSEIAKEYCGRVREIARVVLEGISESLGLERGRLEKAVEWESGLQILAGNLYPPCPNPEAAMGMPPHSDHGLLTLLVHNQIGGLQVKHGDKWVPADSIPNAFLVNTGDHLEILSNGRYRSNIHRAVVNNRSTRISIAVVHGPSLDTVVAPASDLVDAANEPPAYRPVKYRDYLELQQSSRLKDKSCLDSVRVGSSQVES